MTRMTSVSCSPEWSVPVLADEITSTPKTLKLQPDSEILTHLAARFDLIALDSLVGKVTLVRERGGRIVHVTGNLQADVVQKCVVTLDPVPAHIEESFESFFADPQQAVSFARAKAEINARKGVDEMPMPDERDDPEPIEDGKIDVGELVAQYLSLALDPYPRAVQASSTSSQEGGPRGDSPFAVLKDWKSPP